MSWGHSPSAEQRGDEVEWSWDRDTRLTQLPLDEYPPEISLRPLEQITRALQHLQ
jgi:hypothetical protein